MYRDKALPRVCPNANAVMRMGVKRRGMLARGRNRQTSGVARAWRNCGKFGYGKLPQRGPLMCHGSWPARTAGDSLVAFTQATGPLEGWRQRAPQEILQRLPTAQQDIPAYDMTGLIQENLHLRSTDGGANWARFSSDPFSSAMNGYSQGSVLVLADGTILVVGHTGNDDAYGKTDQAIVLNRLRLEVR